MMIENDEATTKTHSGVQLAHTIQSVERQVDHGTSSGSPYISVVYEQKWLKFGLQAHFLKMFGHTKFQLSTSCTFKAMKLLVMY